jgi:hypothetical protein
MDDSVSGVVITSEARNLLLLALERPLRKQQIPHGLKAVRDDNSNSRSRTLLMQQSNKAREYYNGLDAGL